MARTMTDLSIADLQRLLNRRRRQIDKLQRKREKLEKKLAVLDAAIVELGGSPSGPGRRARNTLSLNEAIHQVLEKADRPLPVGDILEQVQRTGYRSSSANFRGIVNQTLIKDKHFSAVQRGVYGLKKK